jgi:ubiquinone/menaquinone biosynthesis C-methylase UbiE
LSAPSTRHQARSTAAESPEGWHGWDAYAKFYDWENARTAGRRDVRFWQRFVIQQGGRLLELGAGTGRVTIPLARAGVTIVGVDRSAKMLDYARRRLRRMRSAHRAALVRADIRALPHADGAFDIVIAPYGILQSLLRDRDLSATLDAVGRVLAPGGWFGFELVPDVPNWREYENRVTLHGRRGTRGPVVTLTESVRQDRARGLTTCHHAYTEGWGRARRTHRFTVSFRTLPVRSMTRRLERRGFSVEALLGGYDGRPFDERADAWIVLARAPGRGAAAGSPRPRRRPACGPRSPSP